VALSAFSTLDSLCDGERDELNRDGLSLNSDDPNEGVGIMESPSSGDPNTVLFGVRVMMMFGSEADTARSLLLGDENIAPPSRVPGDSRPDAASGTDDLRLRYFFF